MLRLENIKHDFGETLLTYPDWQVGDGEDALILGGSGSGKTTLLHIVTGLLQPTHGAVFLEGQNLARMSKGQLDDYRGKTVGLIFQKPHLVRALTVEENVKLAMKFNHKKIANERLSEVLEALGIMNLRERRIYQLSEGQAQRVSIARAVFHEPKLLAADEPTASLDDENCRRVIELLKNQAERCQATLLIATHDKRVKDEFTNQLTL